MDDGTMLMMASCQTKLRLFFLFYLTLAVLMIRNTFHDCNVSLVTRFPTVAASAFHASAIVVPLTTLKQISPGPLAKFQHSPKSTEEA